MQNHVFVSYHDNKPLFHLYYFLEANRIFLQNEQKIVMKNTIIEKQLDLLDEEDEDKKEPLSNYIKKLVQCLETGQKF
jgi:hypothetical protein